MASAEAKHCRGVEPRRGAGRRDLGTRARASMCRIQRVSFQSKRLRRSVEPRRGAGRRNLGTHVWHCKSLISNIHPARNDNMGRSLPCYILDGLRTLQGAIRRERPAYRSARPPTKRARSRTLQQVRTSPTNEKLPHKTPPLQKAKQIIAHVMAGFCGEVLGERGRFGGREPPLRKRGPCASKVFLPFNTTSPNGVCGGRCRQ